jgi:cytochrome c biogenesis protein CcdA
LQLLKIDANMRDMSEEMQPDLICLVDDTRALLLQRQNELQAERINFRFVLGITYVGSVIGAGIAISEARVDQTHQSWSDVVAAFAITALLLCLVVGVTRSWVSVRRSHASVGAALGMLDWIANQHASGNVTPSEARAEVLRLVR